MKKFIFFFLILASTLFSQNWNNVVQTSIPYNDFGIETGIDQFANRDGINVLVDYYSYLKYYLINSSGSTIRTYTFENQAVEFISIDGDNDKIYVVYKLGNQIKTRKSTNAGQNWTSVADISIGSNNCNHIDVVFGKDDNSLHVVWATQDAGSDYKTYYRKLASNDQWSTQEDVTDGSLVGGFPTVSTSLNRVHVSYNTGNSSDPATNLGEAKSRDKYVNTWQASQLVYSPQSFRERIHAGNLKLFDFYYQLQPGEGQYTSILYVKNRDLNNPTWSLPIQLNYGADVYNIVSATNTSDSKTHITYANGNIVYRNFNGASWSSEFEIGSGFLSPKISSTSNDLFVVWGGYGIDNVYFRQYAAVPLAPQNLTISSVNGSPSLNWTKNNEADLSLYEISRKDDMYGNIWQVIATTTNNSFIDFQRTIFPYGYLHTTYRVRAKDVQAHFSAYSNEVSTITVPYKMLSPVTNNDNFENKIQNYPNPFNPSTKIIYSIKQDGLVTLKIYDILGREIRTLVNEFVPAGNYEVVFNASLLPSGMYIYKIQSGSFTDAKKMLLTK